MYERRKQKGLLKAKLVFFQLYDTLHSMKLGEEKRRMDMCLNRRKKRRRERERTGKKWEKRCK